MMKSVTTRMLAALTLAGCALPAVAQTTVSVRLDGLPAGLTAAVGAEFRCGAAGAQNLGDVPLTEQTLVTWEAVPLFGGGMQLVQRTRTAYVAPYRLPGIFPACSEGRNVKFNLFVIGDQEARKGSLGNWDFTSTALNVTVEAKTTGLFGIVNQTAVPLTTATRGAAQHWVASYASPMGLNAVVEPTLDFLRVGNVPFPGALASVVRLSITRDGAVCARSGGTTTCRTKAQGGPLIVGGVSVDVGNTSHSAGGGSTSWRFTLLPGTFAAGNYTVRAAANDFDSIEYLVDNQASALDLLPWKPLNLPLQVM